MFHCYCWPLFHIGLVRAFLFVFFFISVLYVMLQYASFQFFFIFCLGNGGLSKMLNIEGNTIPIDPFVWDQVAYSTRRKDRYVQCCPLHKLSLNRLFCLCNGLICFIFMTYIFVPIKSYSALISVIICSVFFIRSVITLTWKWDWRACIFLCQ